MKEIGTVVKCKNNYISVRIGRNSACASCGKCGMTEKQKHVDFYVENTQKAKEGDLVEVDIPENSTVHLALVAYILPLVPALILMFVALALKWEVWFVMLMFFGGLALGFGLVVVIDKLRKHKWMQAPTLVRVVPPVNPVAVAVTSQQKETIDMEAENE